MSSEVEEGDVIQINPDHEPEWCAGMLAVVDEVRTWGVKCTISALGEDRERMLAPMRIEFGQFERVGPAPWPEQVTGR